MQQKISHSFEREIYFIYGAQEGTWTLTPNGNGF